MLKVQNISKKFGKKTVVNNISFEINEGEILGLLGTNGAGKTTTFRMILGIFAPNEGSITLNGEKISIKDSAKIGFLPEERSLLPKLTVREQLMFFGELKGKKKNDLMKEIDTWLTHFDMKETLDMQIKELSKGNQQKIQFISSIIHKPELLILDEPFSGLDPISIRLIYEGIKKIQGSGTKIIFSSHRLDYVENFSKNILVLEKGNPIISGNLDDIKKSSSEYHISVVCDQEIDGLAQNKNIASYTYEAGEYDIVINSYEKVDLVFDFIKEYNIRGFTVNLPNLEQIILSKVGDKNE